MNATRLKLAFPLFLLSLGMFAQEQLSGTTWSLDKCISYSQEKNIDVRKASVTTEVNNQYVIQKQGQRFPTLSASVSQGFGVNKILNTTTNKYGNYGSYSSTNASLSSSVTLYNGSKINNNIKQAKLTYEASKYDAVTSKETISLTVLDAYLQVIYAKELVSTSKEELKSTEEQLKLADERIKQGLLSKADYLVIKAQLADEKLTLANAESNYSITKLTLMQLMEIPVSGAFDIVYPDLSHFSGSRIVPDAETVYNTSLNIKPQVKSAALNKDIAELDIKIAKADLLPKLTLTGAVSTLYSSSLDGLSYNYQLTNRLAPSVDLTLSIPIFQQNQVKTAIKIAKLNTQTAELNELNTRNQLRKSIEQACQDVTAAQTKYLASQEKYDAVKEAYEVAQEKFAIGLMSSSDFIVQKTKYITSESELLQSKFNLIFSNKILDFYSGIAISL